MGIRKASSGNDAITLNINGALINYQKVVSEERACYFSTMADEIGGRDNLSFSEDDFTLHPSVINIKHNQPNSDVFFFTEIMVDGTIKSLENLNSSKSTGWDLIPLRGLKPAAKELGPSLTDLYNLSIKYGQYLKQCRVSLKQWSSDSDWRHGSNFLLANKDKFQAKFLASRAKHTSEHVHCWWWGDWMHKLSEFIRSRSR